MCYSDDWEWPRTSASDWCCYGAVLDGPARCTCWVPVYDVEQQLPLQVDAPTLARPGMCASCAYRPGSPERRGEPDAAADHEYLAKLVALGMPFFCHEGMRRPVQWLHPPSGERVAGSVLDYKPPGDASGRPYRADGRPAMLCGGWWAMRFKHEQQQAARPAAACVQ